MDPSMRLTCETEYSVCPLCMPHKPATTESFIFVPMHVLYVVCLSVCLSICLSVYIPTYLVGIPCGMEFAI